MEIIIYICLAVIGIGLGIFADKSEWPPTFSFLVGLVFGVVMAIIVFLI